LFTSLSTSHGPSGLLPLGEGQVKTSNTGNVLPGVLFKLCLMGTVATSW